MGCPVLPGRSLHLLKAKDLPRSGFFLGPSVIVDTLLMVTDVSTDSRQFSFTSSKMRILKRVLLGKSSGWSFPSDLSPYLMAPCPHKANSRCLSPSQAAPFQSTLFLCAVSVTKSTHANLEPILSSVSTNNLVLSASFAFPYDLAAHNSESRCSCMFMYGQTEWHQLASL